MPKIGTGKGVDEIGKAEQTEIGAAQSEIGERVKDGDNEWNQDSDRQQERRRQNQKWAQSFSSRIFFSGFRELGSGRIDPPLLRVSCGWAHPGSMHRSGLAETSHCQE